MQEIIVQTHQKKCVIDITNQIASVLAKLVAEHPTGKSDHWCHLFIPHTTAALTTSLLDTKSELDLIGMIEYCIPHTPLPGEKQSIFHSHHHAHLSAHVIASILGSSLVVPIVHGKLTLGELQRIVLVELNGPRARTVLIHI